MDGGGGNDCSGGRRRARGATGLTVCGGYVRVSVTDQSDRHTMASGAASVAATASLGGGGGGGGGGGCTDNVVGSSKEELGGRVRKIERRGGAIEIAARKRAAGHR